MKKMLCMLTTAIVLSAAVVTNVEAQKLPKFGADLGMKSIKGKEIRIPYTQVVSYYGYAKPGAPADGVDNGKKMYYIYIWVPAVAPEIGVRMISPVPSGMKPGKADYTSKTWAEGSTDTEHFFDTWITLERADGITNEEDFSNAASAKWNRYGVNDDSGEMPANPKGSQYNSLMRITSEVDNPLKALVRGLYRVGFTTFKTGEVEGTFLAQVGAPVKLPGVAIGATVAELTEQIAAAKTK
ncbi:MAG: major surface lipoprotein LipL32 [Termitinemataceae bacterium]|nr:MAG: major surface lipoprotein LipL32 [Termitinemataceae bacterium]